MTDIQVNIEQCNDFSRFCVDEKENTIIKISKAKLTDDKTCEFQQLNVHAKPFVYRGDEIRWRSSSCDGHQIGLGELPPQDVRCCDVDCDAKESCQVSFSTFKRRDPFESFRKHGQRTVCGSCIISEGHVLLVKQRECSKWGFPKGSKEWNESKYACMVRELHEETGIHLHQHPHCDFLYSKTFFESTIYFFEIPTRIVNLKPHDTTEIETVAWVPLSELKQLSLNRITDFIKRNILLKSFPQIGKDGVIDGVNDGRTTTTTGTTTTRTTTTTGTTTTSTTTTTGTTTVPTTTTSTTTTGTTTNGGVVHNRKFVTNDSKDEKENDEKTWKDCNVFHNFKTSRTPTHGMDNRQKPPRETEKRYPRWQHNGPKREIRRVCNP